MSQQESRMSFLEHLQELRYRLMHAAAAIIIGFIICISFSKRLFEFLSAPLIDLLPKNSSLVFTALPDPFFMYLKVSFVAGVFIAIPYVLYQLWKFIAPGLYQKERSLALPFVVAATGLFYVGAVFAYFVVFPVVFKFFLGFQSADLRPMISIKEYVSLIMKLMLAFGAIFETPIIIIFLGLLGLVDTAFLKKGRRYFVVIAFVVGAILSPPDVISQILMGLPLLLLYEASIHILAMLEKKRKAAEDEEAEVSSSEESS